MPTHNIIVIGGSTGSIAVLKRICADLPADLDAAVFVTVHVGSDGLNALAPILDQAGPLAAGTAKDGESIEPGRIFVAPADWHLLLSDGVVRLGHGPRENMTRPAIDPLFRSAAVCCGPRVIGVVLSGHLNDGAAGLAAVKRCGGLAVVQSPSDAEAADMPLGALQACDVDYKAPAAELGALLAALARQPAGPPVSAPRDVALEASIALGREIDSPRLLHIADPSPFPCPGCGGVLSELHDKRPLRFRCQIGHAYTAEVLDRDHEPSTQQALAIALRIVEARATLVERMARDARENGRERTAATFEDRAREYRRDIEVIRRAMLHPGPGASDD